MLNRRTLNFCADVLELTEARRNLFGTPPNNMVAPKSFHDTQTVFLSGQCGLPSTAEYITSPTTRANKYIRPESTLRNSRDLQSGGEAFRVNLIPLFLPICQRAMLLLAWEFVPKANSDSFEMRTKQFAKEGHSSK